jgi:hypothetical protein
MENRQIDLEEVVKSITNMGEVISKTLTPLFQELIVAVQIAYDAFWQAYKDASMPYGETDEGLLRWVKEIGEVRRLQFEAERILLHHQMLVDFRQKIQEKAVLKAVGIDTEQRKEE